MEEEYWHRRPHFILEVNDLIIEISNASLPNYLETTKYLKSKGEMQNVDLNPLEKPVIFNALIVSSFSAFPEYVDIQPSPI